MTATTAPLNGAAAAPRPAKPKALPVNPEVIPAALRERPQWVVWRYTWNPKKKRKDGSGAKGDWDKPPYSARTGKLASSTDPDTWSPFAEALAAYQAGGWDGIGFVPTPEDGLAVIDLDACRDRDTGAVEPWAGKIVGEMDTYAEASPSATGLRIVAFARKPDRERSKKGPVEIYDGLTKEDKPGGRYLTFTGHKLDGAPADVCERQEQLAEVYRRALKPPPAEQARAERNGHANGKAEHTNGAPTDEDIIAKVRRGTSKRGVSWAALWDGGQCGYPSPSEGDLALCGRIAFFAGRDTERVDRIFRQSGRDREKWKARADYRESTLDRAVGGKTSFYDWTKKRRKQQTADGGPGLGAAEAPDGGRGGYAIILDHFRRKYNPLHKRGTAIFSGTLGREVKQGEALCGAPYVLLAELASAINAPRNRDGQVNVNALPQFFATWARSAWVDLLDPLDVEEQAGEVHELAREEFRGKVAAALLRLESFQYTHKDAGGEERVETQRRSLLSWCELWAKTKHWGQVRSLCLWCRKTADTREQLEIALRKDLFAQIHQSMPVSAKKFAQLCELYDVGRAGEDCRAGGQRVIILHTEFVQELQEQPEQPAGCRLPDTHAHAHGKVTGNPATEGGNTDA